MKALQDFLSDNCIPTVEFKLVSLIPFLLTLYVAVALLTFFRECVEECCSNIKMLFKRFLRFVNESFQHQTFNSRVCHRGTRDVISSDLPFMEWHVRLTFTRQENTSIQSDKDIHGTIGNRAWSSLNGRSHRAFDELKNRHVLGHFIKCDKIRQGKPLLHVEQQF